jgi:ATP-dependent RNA helicase DDX27
MLFHIRGLNASELSGDLLQATRLKELYRFVKGETDFMICTDVAARGLDIKGVETIINYDMPLDLKTYIHRVGRTARIGAEGVAVSLVGDNDRRLLKQVVKHAKNKNILHRVVPADSIKYWKDILKEMEPQLVEMQKEDRFNKELEKTEVEAQKTENMMKHSQEILSRPARKWIMTEKQKKMLKEKEKDALGIDKTGKKRVRDEEKPKQNKRSKYDQEITRKSNMKARDQRVLEDAGIKDFKAFARAGKTKTKRHDRNARVGIVTKETIDSDRAKQVAKKEKKDVKKASQQKKKEAKMLEQPKEEKKKPVEERRRVKHSGSGFKSQKKYKRR